MRRTTAFSATALGCLLATTSAHAQEVKVDFGGGVQADLRFAIPNEKLDSYGEWYQDLPARNGVARNQLILKMKMRATMGKFSANTNVDFVLRGYSNELREFEALSNRPDLEPFYFEAHSLFLEGRDLLFPGFDLRVGNMVIDWGAGDRFNPTNTLNPLDLEDVLLFGEQQANMMVRADYSPTWWLQFNAVLVPVFKPALLPTSSVIGLAAVDRVPFLDDDLRHRVHAETAIGKDLTGYPTIVSSVVPELPTPSARNMQFMFRASALAGPLDVAVSYYRGFSDIPVPMQNFTRQVPGDACNPVDAEDCISGLLQTETTLGYPRMDVLGLNLAGEANLFGWVHKSFKPIGFRLEAAVIFPERRVIRLDQEDLDFGIVSQPAGEYPYPMGTRPEVIDGRPFPKWVLGLDYTFNKHVYMNTQWVHGFPDEFGAGSWVQEGWTVREGGVTTDTLETLGCVLEENGEKCAREILKPRIGDYLVLGLDFRFLSQKLLVRLFTIWDMVGVWEDKWDENAGQRTRIHHNMFTKEGFGAVIYPEINYNFGNGLEIHGGALIQLGQFTGKFGDPAAGGSLIWTRAKYSF